jgi:ABC-type multidrug transport system ATPase subunit
VLAGVGDEHIDEVLEVVSLTGRDAHRGAGYSLGMKQRPTISAALPNDPGLLSEMGFQPESR